MPHLQNFVLVGALLLSTNGPALSLDTLRLVHVLFRHGDRTNDAGSTYPTDPHRNCTYPPYGIGQLTNKGRQREFWIGKYLRSRYDTFLERVYTHEVLDARSTDLNRTKESALLVLAGLYQPKGTALEWNLELNWLAIPYNYVPFAEDKVMTFSLFFCPNYIKLYQAYLNTTEALRMRQEYNWLFEYLSEHTGMTFNTFFDASCLYFGLKAEDDWGLPLPEWTRKVYPRHLTQAAIQFYRMSTATTQLKQLTGGFLLKKIILDTLAKIKNTLVPQDRKLFLYSAHEITIANLMRAMEIYFPHIPPYGAYLLIELHQIGFIYGIKVFYQDYSGDDPKPLKISGCQHFCPIKKFVKLLEKNLPTDDNVCGKDLAARHVHPEKRRLLIGI